jgi:hypothetical protein
MNAIAILLVAASMVGVAEPGQSASAERQATPGLAASGEILSERDHTLRLNTTPCRATQAVTIFHMPYVRVAAGEVNCNGARGALVQVIQR